MKKAIILTTIQEPTEATYKFSITNGWELIVVGDLKTPHKSYEKINCTYLHPDWQYKNYPKLSDSIGWNCIQRRNIGFVYAYEQNFDIIGSVDDDNIPYDKWGQDVRVGQEIEIDVWDSKIGVFDPLQLTNQNHLWHRGYPIDCIKWSRQNTYKGKQKRKILFQADLWDGDPDIDAICRIMYSPIVDLKMQLQSGPFTSNDFMPFNSQNTFIAREAIPYYMAIPFVGRMDDIWGGYIAQYLLGTRPLFMPASVYQRRNEQSIRKNLEDEILGYTTTSKFIEDMNNYGKYLPEKTLLAMAEYRLAYERLQ